MRVARATTYVVEANAGVCTLCPQLHICLSTAFARKCPAQIAEQSTAIHTGQRVLARACRLEMCRLLRQLEPDVADRPCSKQSQTPNAHSSVCWIEVLNWYPSALQSSGEHPERRRFGLCGCGDSPIAWHERRMTMASLQSACAQGTGIQECQRRGIAGELCSLLNVNPASVSRGC